MICRVCDSNNLDLAIDLGEQPWCNNFLTSDEIGKEPFYPLRVVYCQGCSTAQLDYTVKKEVMFGNHTYLSGVTKSLSEHFRKVAEYTNATYFRDIKSKSVLDIGSNDGTQLKHFQALGYEVLGVESSIATAQIANDAGIPTLNAYFNQDVAREIGLQFNIINASGVFFHLEELHSVTDGIKEALHQEGVFVVQFLYMDQIIQNMAFDQIYHEHLLYYNLKTIEILLNRHGLSMFDAYLSPIHGGSMIAFVSHTGSRKVTHRLAELRDSEAFRGSNDFQTYLDFADRIKLMRNENIKYLDDAKSKNKIIFVMGAPVKVNTLLNYFVIGPNYIDALIEKNELRRGLYSPGMHIPVLIERELTQPPDIYYVLAWNFKNEILSNNQDLLSRGVEFFFPVNPKGFDR